MTPNRNGLAAPFRAGRKARCKGCGHFYQVGDVIVSPGKGQGAYHKRCWANHGPETRTATAADLDRLKNLRAARYVARDPGGCLQD